MHRVSPLRGAVVHGFEGAGGVEAPGPTQTYTRGRRVVFRRRGMVNLRLSEPEGVARIPIRRHVGLEGPRDLPRDGRCVADYWF